MWLITWWTKETCWKPMWVVNGTANIQIFWSEFDLSANQTHKSSPVSTHLIIKEPLSSDNMVIGHGWIYRWICWFFFVPLESWSSFLWRIRFLCLDHQWPPFTSSGVNRPTMKLTFGVVLIAISQHPPLVFHWRRVIKRIYLEGTLRGPHCNTLIPDCPAPLSLERRKRDELSGMEC